VATKNQTLSYGATLRGKKAEFRVWAPIPNEITLRLTHVGAEPRDIPMPPLVTDTPIFSTVGRRFLTRFHAFSLKVCMAHPRS
jgi:hypothetical protein